MWDAFSTIIRQEGPGALYRGSGAAFLLTANGGIQFVIYETLRKYYYTNQSGGGGSGGRGTFTTTTTTTTKAAAAKTNQSTVGSFLSNPTTTITPTKSASPKSVQERVMHSVGFMTMGAIAKIIASTVTYPLQVAKSRMQQRADATAVVDFTAAAPAAATTTHTNNSSSGSRTVVPHPWSVVVQAPPSQPYYRDGLGRTLQRIVQTEGIRGLYKGCLPNALRVAPSAAITFVVYEITMDYCRLVQLQRWS